MTRNEFNQKFDSAYKAAIRSVDMDNIVENILHSVADETGNLSQEAITTSIFKISLTLNERILRSVLSEILELDE